MTNKWVYVLIALTLLSFVLFFYQRSSVLSSQKTDRPEAYNVEQIHLLTENILLNNRLSNKILSVELENLNGTKVSLSSMQDSVPKLVYFYSELTCNMCVDQSFEFLNTFIREIGADKAIILVESSSPRYITTLARLNKIKTSNILRVTEKNIDFNNKGFFFILDKSIQMQNTFFPMKEYPTITQDYFTNIKDRFTQS